MDKKFQPILWLQQKKFKAYVVGNQSRSQLLGTICDPNDIDMATNAKPSQIVKILRQQNILPSTVNDKFGVVSFTWQNNEYEITTFRQDFYNDQFNHIRRTPSQIKFIEDVAIDAKRRDITINAIYWNPVNNRYIDPENGKNDLKSKIIRFIGNPEIRIKEDPIRVLRAIRFKFYLGFNYDSSTRTALKKFGSLIYKISATSLKREFYKIQNLPNYHLAKKEMKVFGIIPRF